MNFKRLQYFCTIVEQGQISRAAQLLKISQPPLSQRLKELEMDVGTQLILREGNQWEVTAAGKELYKRARLILEDLHNLKSEIIIKKSELSGLVTIGVSTNCEPYLLEVLPELHQEHPDIKIRLLVMDSNHLEQKIMERKIDLAILLLPIAGDEYDIYPLDKDNLSIVSNSSILLPSITGITLEEVANYPLILSRRWDGGGSHDLIMKYWQEHHIAPKIILDSHNIFSLLHLITTGFPAVTIVPTRSALYHQTTNSNYQIRALIAPVLDISPVILTRKKQYLRPAVSTLLHKILEQVGQERQ